MADFFWNLLRIEAGVALLVVVCSVASAKPDFIDHGVAAEVARSRGAVAVDTGEGEHRLAVWLHDHRGGYGLLLVDPDTGDTSFQGIPFSTDDSPFAVLYSKKGYLYTLFGHRFLEFDPRAGEFTHVAESRDRVAMWMTEGDDGRIWAGNYPAAHIVSFDPETREFVDYGAVNEENWPQYPRALATDDSGWIYTMIGFTRNHILALDPESGEVRPMVDDADRSGGNVTLWRGEDGLVYARMPAEGAPWLRLAGGGVTALDGEPPVEPVDEVSGHQGIFYGKLPDGREITRLNVPDRWLEVRDADEISTRVSFDYPSEGSWIFALANGPDERIYGSTGHPLRFFAYDPAEDSFWDVPVSGGHVNAMTVQAGKLFGAIYTQGVLIEYEPGRRGTSAAPNPRRLASAGDILLRPHDLLALSDGRHLIQVGTPGYGRTGGGMMVWDMEAEEARIYEHTELIEYHSTKALAELPDGNLIGGTSTAPGTGGERIAEECLLYIMEWPSLEIVFKKAILPGVQEIRELLAGPDERVYGLAVDGTFFVFDREAREVVHTENLSESYGPITGGQAPRVWERFADGKIYCLFRHAIVRIDPETFAHEKLASTPVDANIGVALHDGRLYFSSGSRLWSYGIGETGPR